MNEKLREIANCAPIIKQMTGVDTAIAVWNKEAVVEAYFKADKININFDVGYKDEDKNSKINKVLRTGIPDYNKLPKEVFGQAFEGTITPIFDNGEVVGVVTYIFLSEVKDNIVDNANNLSASIIETDKSIESILENSKELSSNMNKVKEITDSVVTKVDDAIEIVKVIQQNAKQSNILALNASIESARAGEAGKGFAVVSDEMRKFAKMSAEASDKISESLGDIVKSLTKVKESVDTSKNMAVEQTDIINNLDNIFTDVSNKAAETIEVCKKITTI